MDNSTDPLSNKINLAEFIQWVTNKHRGDELAAISDILETLGRNDLHLYERVESKLRPRIVKSYEPCLVSALKIRQRDFDEIPF